MNRLCIVAILTGVMTISSIAQEYNAKWMVGGFGLMIMELGDKNASPEKWDAIVDSIDVKAMVAQAKRFGARWVGVALGMVDGHYCAPGAILMRESPKCLWQLCSRRNLPRELGEEAHRNQTPVVMLSPYQFKGIRKNALILAPIRHSICAVRLCKAGAEIPA